MKLFQVMFLVMSVFAIFGMFRFISQPDMLNLGKFLWAGICLLFNLGMIIYCEVKELKQTGNK